MAVLFKKPVLLLPLFFSWVIFALVVLYGRYYFPDFHNVWLAVLYVYLLLTVISSAVLFSNTVLLELIQQMETGKKTSLIKALRETVTSDLIRVIPIALIWSFVWLIILILRALTRKRRGTRHEPSLKDAAKTLSGMNANPVSWFGLGLDMLEKLVRMTVFTTLPAVTWENKGPVDAFKRGFEVIKRHPVQFLTSYSLTLLAVAFVSLPLVPIYLLDKQGVELPSAVWLGVLIYAGVVWTLEVYLEQMAVAVLYLWHLKWLKAGGKGPLSSVKKPDLFDDVYELKE
ncbi:hypothetical protein J7K41_00500 [Candidatus Micrarchaeota archaeon]|nr:hypothetical protein [Candidatus Micrarchaeota archaeon]